MHGCVPHIIHQGSRTSCTASALLLHTTSPLPGLLQRKQLGFKMLHKLRAPRPKQPPVPCHIQHVTLHKKWTHAHKRLWMSINIFSYEKSSQERGTNTNSVTPANRDLPKPRQPTSAWKERTVIEAQRFHAGTHGWLDQNHYVQST